MQAAARKLRRTDVRRAPALRLAPPPAPKKRSPARSPRARTRAQEARARSVFTFVAVGLLAVSVVALARVAVLVRATEMAMDSGHLQQRIEAQRLETDRLEIDRSALAAPSRIVDIAGATMQMGTPKSVRYIQLPAGTDDPVDGVPVTGPGEGSTARADIDGPLGEILRVVMDLSAGEAQTLLVGDVGLAGSR
jgi:cell division protein FtsL